MAKSRQVLSPKSARRPGRGSVALVVIGLVLIAAACGSRATKTLTDTTSGTTGADVATTLGTDAPTTSSAVTEAPAGNGPSAVPAPSAAPTTLAPRAPATTKAPAVTTAPPTTHAPAPTTTMAAHPTTTSSYGY
jgi:hypothetical protein